MIGLLMGPFLLWVHERGKACSVRALLFQVWAVCKPSTARRMWVKGSAMRHTGPGQLRKMAGAARLRCVHKPRR